MKCKSDFSVFISVMSALGAVCFSTAADYYVDADAGDDSNDGSEGSPWRTITHALDRRVSQNGGGSSAISGNGDDPCVPRLSFEAGLQHSRGNWM